uniref:Uncharacterized protein n=1 Tax=Anguilla anguilla TaxID=7936 RepID=A0A0E9Y2A4_ANGAN
MRCTGQGLKVMQACKMSLYAGDLSFLAASEAGAGLATASTFLGLLLMWPMRILSGLLESKDM